MNAAQIAFVQDWEGPYDTTYFTRLRALGDPEPDGAPEPEQDACPLLLPPPSDPMAVAHRLVERYTRGQTLTQRHWRGGWWSWAGSHWVEREERAVKRE